MSSLILLHYQRDEINTRRYLLVQSETIVRYKCGLSSIAKSNTAQFNIVIT